jgi:dihydropteroate synthase
MIIGNKSFDTTKEAYIMGILNVTPDSFSDGGRYNSFDKAMKHVEQMVEEGAHIIDVGGESTRPGYTLISDQEEISRVAPVIEGIKKHFDIAIAVDTYKEAVAEAAIVAGADMVNDIWGLRYNGKMADVIGKYDAACTLMHNRNNTVYKDFVTEVVEDLTTSVNMALAAGVSQDKILIDPGIGFGKTYEQNLQMMKELERLQEIGYPILLGTSKKSIIGLTLNIGTDERVEGTIATTVIGYMKGCRIFRVHNVKENLRALRMTEAIMQA